MLLKQLCSGPFCFITCVVLLTEGFFSTSHSANYAAWQYQKNIYLNTTANGAQITQPVSNFPVLVRLTALNFTFSQAAPSGSDLRFSKHDGTTALPYQIETWDNTAQVASIWVLVDTVFGNNGTQFFIMHWGASTGPATPSLSDGASVFDTANGFSGVWHMTDTVDATKNRNKMTRGGGVDSPVTTNGLIGSTYSFSGTGAYMDVANSSTLDMNSYFTASLWVRHDMSSLSRWERLLSRKYNYNDTVGWEVTLVDQAWPHACSTGVSMMLSNGGINPDDIVTSWFDGNWRLLTMVFNNDSMYLYGDGELKTSSYLHPSTQVLVDSVCTPILFDGETLSVACQYIYNTFYDTQSFKPVDNDLPIRIGGTQDNDPYNWFFGKLDEIRLEKRVRPREWIKLCYENQKVDQTFASVGIAPVVGVVTHDANNWVRLNAFGRFHMKLYNVYGKIIADKIVDASEHPNLESIITSEKGMLGRRMGPGVYIARLYGIDKKNRDRIFFSGKIMFQR